MTSKPEIIKQLTLRWPEYFWEAVKIAALTQRTSSHALITEAVADKLGIPVPTQHEDGDGSQAVGASAAARPQAVNRKRGRAV